MPVQDGRTKIVMKGSPSKIVMKESPFGDVEIHDLIGKSPSWILRSGITILGMVTVVIIAFSMVIRFPDKIQAPVLITTENPPIEVVAKAGGKIEKLYVAEKQHLEKGATIAYIENTTQAEDVQQLIDFFAQFDAVKNNMDYQQLQYPKALSLGDFQAEATSFGQHLSEFQALLKQKGTRERVSSAQREIQKMEELNQVYQKEKELLQEELDWTIKDKNRFKALKEEKMVSDKEYEDKEIALIQQQRQLENAGKESIRSQIRIEELRTQQLQWTEERQKKIQDYIFSLREMKYRIHNSIREWDQQYFVRATVAGMLNLPVALVESMVVREGDKIGFIVPGDQAGKIMAQAKAGIAGIGKIKNGDRVFIRLDAFPYKEFGSIESQVSEIALMPSLEEGNGLFYSLIIDIGTEIVTDYQQKIPYRPNMSGMAFIITEDKSLFDRIFEQFIRLLKN